MADDTELKSEELRTEDETKTDSIARTRNDEWVKVTANSDISCDTQKILAEDWNCSAVHSILPSNVGRPRIRYARDELLDSQFHGKEKHLGRWNEVMGYIGHIVAEIHEMEKTAEPRRNSIDKSQSAHKNEEASKGKNPLETILDTANSDSKRQGARKKKKASKGKKPSDTIPGTTDTDSKGGKPPDTISENSDSRGQRTQKKKAAKGENPPETILDKTNSDPQCQRTPKNEEASQVEKSPDTIPDTINSGSRRQGNRQKKKKQFCKEGESLDTIPDTSNSSSKGENPLDTIHDTTNSDSRGQRTPKNKEAEKPFDTIHDATNLDYICQKARKDKDASMGEKPLDAIPGPLLLIRSHEQCNEELPSQLSESNTADIQQSSTLSYEVLSPYLHHK